MYCSSAAVAAVETLAAAAVQVDTSPHQMFTYQQAPQALLWVLVVQAAVLSHQARRVATVFLHA